MVRVKTETVHLLWLVGTGFRRVAVISLVWLAIRGSTGRGHSLASLAGCLANSLSAIQLLIYIDGFKPGIKHWGSYGWWERRQREWWGDVCKMRWIRRRVNKMRSTERKYLFVFLVLLLVSESRM